MKHGPTYLEGYNQLLTAPFNGSEKEFEWRRQIVASNGELNFRIKYFGSRHQIYDSLITYDGGLGAKIIAVAQDSNEEIVLFDDSLHGYNAMFVDDPETRRRVPNKIYSAPNGEQIFRIVVSAYYQIDFDFEYEGQENFELTNGTVATIDRVKRDAFDWIGISAITNGGQRIQIFDRETA